MDNALLLAKQLLKYPTTINRISQEEWQQARALAEAVVQKERRYAILENAVKLGLIEAVSLYSEIKFSSGWHTGVENHLWPKIFDSSTQTFRILDVDSPLTAIAQLAAASGGWVAWDDTTDEPVWMSLADWLALKA